MLTAAARLRESRSQVAASESASYVETTADTAPANVQNPKDTKTAKSRASKDKSEKLKSVTRTSPSEASAFAGMKKGFLLGSGAKKQSKSQAARPAKPLDADSSIPFIRPKQSKDGSRVLPEVQKVMEAMKSLSAMDAKEWITDDLLKNITSHPTIGPKLSNPKFVKVLQQVQTNPQQARKEHGDNPEMGTFVKELCLVLGDHFTSLGDKLSSPTKQKTTKQKTAGQQSVQRVTVQAFTNYVHL